MSIYVGVNGGNKEVKDLYIGQGGVNKQVNEAYMGVNGVNKLVYQRGGSIFSEILNGGFTMPTYSSGPVVYSTSNNTLTITPGDIYDEWNRLDSNYYFDVTGFSSITFRFAYFNDSHSYSTVAKMHLFTSEGHTVGTWAYPSVSYSHALDCTTEEIYVDATIDLTTNLTYVGMVYIQFMLQSWGYPATMKVKDVVLNV